MRVATRTPVHRWLTALLLVGGFISLFLRFRRENYLSFYDDDLFYYLKIAGNLVARHRSTFDGLHLTNGYHPLWLLVLTVPTAVAGGTALFLLIQAFLCACFTAIVLTTSSILGRFSQDASAIQLVTTVIALQSLLVLRGGMEVNLTVPLVLCLCAFRLRRHFQYDLRDAAVCGLLAALVVLSRLDSVLFIATLFAFEFIALFGHSSAQQTRRSAFGRYLLTLTTAVLPVLGYVVVNRILFSTWTPLSAQAKQLRLHHGFTTGALESLLRYLPAATRLLIVYPIAIGVVLATVALLTGRRRVTAPGAQSIVYSLLIFPWLHLLALSWLSDWALWGWYVYPWVLASVAVYIVAFSPVAHAHTSQPTPGLLASSSRLALASIAVFAFVALESRRTMTDNRCYSYGRDLQSFAQTHTGIYAMGDAAGTAGYLMDQPLVQLEGLVMDKPYLDNLRQQRSLNAVLHDYQVRYYVAIDPVVSGACLRATEPAQAGADAPHMQGVFCQLPIATYRHERHTLAVFDLAAQEVSLGPLQISAP
jgi:hypothetical protein